MNTSKKKNKIEELKDTESRQFFYEEHIESGLPIQLRELRKKRRLTQTELAELTGFDQSNISAWENPNYEYTPQIGTLKRFANAFDVPLIVRFGSWEELLDWDNNLSSEKIAPESFDELAERIEKKAKKENEQGDKLSSSSNVRTSPHFASKPVIQKIGTFTLPLLAGLIPIVDKSDTEKNNNEVEFSEQPIINATRLRKTAGASN